MKRFLPLFLLLAACAPQAADDSSTTREDTPTITNVLSNDERVDAVTVTIASPPARGTAVVNADNTITYTPNANEFGTDSYDYQATNEKGDSDTATVSVTIQPVNDAPSFTAPGAQTMATNAARVVQATNLSAGPSSESNQTLTLSATSSDNNVSVTVGSINNGAADITLNTTGTPTTATITVTLSDNGGTENGGLNSTQQTFTVTTLAEEADPPTLTATDASGLEDTNIPLVIAAALTDTDGSETLSVELRNLPAGTTIVGANVQEKGFGFTETASSVAMSVRAARDINGDAISDLIGLNDASPFRRVETAIANGLGGYTQLPALQFEHLGPGDQIRDVFVRDLNNDLTPDLIAITQQTGATILAILYGYGDGTFSSPVLLSTGGKSPVSLEVGDIDNNLTAELVTANSDASISVYLFDQTINFFAAPTHITIPTSSPKLLLEDFTGDQNLDVATIHPTEGVARLFTGNGSGGFSVGAGFAVQFNPIDIVAADFDEDGRKDLLSANATSGSVSLLRNDGAGGFATQTSFPLALALNVGILVEDFDQDGDLDVATIEESSNSILVLPGDGPGDFSSPVVAGEIPEVVRLLADDINGDGTKDLITATQNFFTQNFTGIAINTGTTLNTTLTAAQLNNLTLRPPADFNGVIDSTVTAIATETSTQDQASIAQNISITVQPVNDPPLLLISHSTVKEGTTGVLSTISRPGPRTATDELAQTVSLSFASSDPTVLTTPTLLGGKLHTQGLKQGASTLSVTALDDGGTTNGGINAALETTDVLVVARAQQANLIPVTLTGDEDSAIPIPNDASLVDTDGSEALTVSLVGLPQSTVVKSGATVLSAAPSRLQQSGVNFAPTGQRPIQAATGDFNQDGFTDAATVDSVANTVTILLGDGTGLLHSSQTLNVGKNPQSITTADFDGDKNLDLAVANFSSNNVSIFLGDGKGEFLFKRNIFVGIGPVSIKTALLDPDSTPDLLVANNRSNTISVILNQGSGLFSEAKHLSSGGEQPTDVAVVGSHILVCNFASNLVGRIFNDNGTFTAAQPLPDLVQGPISITDAGGGIFVVSSLLSNNVTFYSGQTPFLTVPTNEQPLHLTSADLNGDSLQDIIVSHAFETSLSVILRQPSTAEGFTLALLPQGDIVRTTALADFNQDQKLDLLTVHPNTDQVNVFFGTGQGTFGDGFTKENINTANKLELGDLVGDKALDIVVLDAGTNTIRSFQNNGEGVFAESSPISEDTPQHIALADLNQDGISDLLRVFHATNISNINLQLSTRSSFIPPDVNLTIDSLVQAVLTEDFTNDGLTDIAVHTVSGSWRVFRNQGGKFGPEIVSSAPNLAPSATIVADMNRDGKQDVVLGVGQQLAIQFGDGKGGFSAPVLTTMPAAILDIAAADLNADGNVDLEVTCTGQLLTLLGTEQGSLFISGTQTSATGLFVKLFDFDRNGSIDRLFFHSNSTVELYPDFSTPRTLQLPGRPTQARVADLNGDGAQDVAVAYTNSTGATSAPLVSTILTGPKSVTATQAQLAGLTVTPPTNFHGVLEFQRVALSTEAGGETISRVEPALMTLLPSVDAPIATPDRFAITANQELILSHLVLLQNDISPDGGELSLISVQNESTGRLVLSPVPPPDDLLVIFEPPLGFTGEASFTYTISDGSNTAVGNVTVVVFSSCGDLVVSSPDEGCDDGNNINGDGCSAVCAIESGFFCSGSPSVCSTPAPCAAADYPAATATITDPNTGHCLAHFQGPLDFDTAEFFCETQGGYLAVPDTSEELALIQTLNNNAWVGLNDIDFEDATDGIPGDDFREVTGAFTTNFSGLFITGQPDNNGEQDCVTSARDDVSCAITLPIVCEVEVNRCGDGVTQLSTNEQCDDGNRIDGDGCDATCQVQAGFDCLIQSPARGFFNTLCFPIVCGDGVVSDGELCDDGNLINGDGCDATCGQEPGQANPDTLTIDEDVVTNIQEITLLANDINIVNILSVELPFACTVSISGSTITITPAANFSGNASFQYTGEDASGAFFSATVTVTVNPLPEVPTLVANNVSGAEDTDIFFNINATIPDADGSEELKVIIDNIPFGSLVGTAVTSSNELFQFGTIKTRDSESVISSFVVTDINLDQFPDVIAVRQPDQISAFVNNGEGDFSAPTDTTLFGNDPAAIVVGDFTHTGQPDIAVANQQLGTVDIMEGFGTGHFKIFANFFVGLQPVSIAAADFNGDNFQDIVTANRGSNTVSTGFSTAPGTINTVSHFNVGTEPIAVLAADLNGDGFQDIITANQVSNNFSVLLGDGTGNFANAVNTTAGLTAPTAMTLGDIDGDTLADLLIAGDLGELSVLRGNGDGTFDTALSFVVGAAPKSLALADINQDGHVDVISANSADDTISILEGTGTGLFASERIFAVGDEPVVVASTDFTRDGAPDVVTANETSVDLSFLENINTLRAELNPGFLNAGVVSIRTPFNFNGALTLPITAVSTELATNASQSTSSSFTLTVNPVNDSVAGSDDFFFATPNDILLIPQEILLRNDVDADSTPTISQIFDGNGPLSLDAFGNIIVDTIGLVSGNVRTFSYIATDGEFTSQPNVFIFVQ